MKLPQDCFIRKSKPDALGVGRERVANFSTMVPSHVPKFNFDSIMSKTK